MADSPLPAGIDDLRSRAFVELLDRARWIDLAPLLVYRIESVPASALVALAWQFDLLGVGGWDLAATEEQQRALLGRAIELHRRKGTAWAIREVLKLVGYAAPAVEEAAAGLFQFRVVLGELSDGDAITPERQQILRGVIEAWKNARSWLTALHFRTPAIMDLLPGPSDSAMEITRRTYHTHNGADLRNGAINYGGLTVENLGQV